VHDPVQEQQWDIRAAYRKGWEVRVDYYDMLLHSEMDLIKGAVKIMKVDGLSEAVEELGKALLIIENAWATISLEWTSALAARDNQMETEGDAE
jgi:hypothetical protein